MYMCDVCTKPLPHSHVHARTHALSPPNTHSLLSLLESHHGRYSALVADQLYALALVMMARGDGGEAGSFELLIQT